MKIRSDNCAAEAGWVEYLVTTATGPGDMHVSVPPDADLGETIDAWWHDEQRMVRLKGWLYEFTVI